MTTNEPDSTIAVEGPIRPLRWYKPTDHPCDREDALWMAMGYGGRYSIQEDGGHYIVWMADDEFTFEQGESVDACKTIAERHWQSQIASLATGEAAAKEQEVEKVLRDATHASLEHRYYPAGGAGKPALVDFAWLRYVGPEHDVREAFYAGYAAALSAQPQSEKMLREDAVRAECAETALSYSDGLKAATGWTVEQAHWWGIGVADAASAIASAIRPPLPSERDATISTGR